METATFAGGCFWCTEAIFQRLVGVTQVVSGYSGLPIVECAQVTFDPAVLPYATLLDVFFATHDPTTLNRQGADVGPQYRSAIFYHSPQQKKLAEIAKSAIPNAVTDITPFENFTPAKNYHQNFYNLHQTAPYCQLVTAPKIKKLVASFPSLLKSQ